VLHSVTLAVVTEVHAIRFRGTYTKYSVRYVPTFRAKTLSILMAVANTLNRNLCTCIPGYTGSHSMVHVEGQCSDGIQTGSHRIQRITLETTILLMHLKVVVLTEAAVLVITDADYWRWLKETSFLRIVNHHPSVSGRSGIRQMWMCLLHAVGSAKSFLVSPLLHFSFVLLLFLSLPVRSHLDSVAPC